MMRTLLPIALSLSLLSCMEPVQIELADTSPLAVGEERVVELYSMRFDLVGFDNIITRDEIVGLPASTQEALWLFDLDLTGESGSQRLMDNAIEQIRQMDPNDPALDQPERNIVRLLQTTPDTANLVGTDLEPMLELAQAIGLSPAEVLADALGIGVEDPFLNVSALTEAFMSNVVSTHPNAGWRRGPPSAVHPDGWIPVPTGHLAITLADIASNFASLAERFGEYNADGLYHPGFVVGTTSAQAVTDEFRLIARANSNALPYKGLDLSHARVGSISSIGRDGVGLFDFSDPNWLRIEGMPERLIVEQLTFKLLEYPEWIPGGNSPLPAPFGNSPVWSAPAWTLERVVAEAGLLALSDRVYSRQYSFADPENPLLSMDIDHGWLEITTPGGVGSPPAPLYLWDLLLEVAQVRLHDGPDPDAPSVGALEEGQAHVELSLTDIDVGITPEQITETLKRVIEQDASTLVTTASVLLGQTVGAVDFYYVRPRSSEPEEVQGDWLYYIAAEDIATGEDERPTRDINAYQRPGFYADANLSEKVSATTTVGLDSTHDKVRVQTGDTLYVQDNEESVFRIEIGEKPSLAKLSLSITRVK